MCFFPGQNQVFFFSFCLSIDNFKVCPQSLRRRRVVSTPGLVHEECVVAPEISYRQGLRPLWEGIHIENFVFLTQCPHLLIPLVGLVAPCLVFFWKPPDLGNIDTHSPLISSPPSLIQYLLLVPNTPSIHTLPPLLTSGSIKTPSVETATAVRSLPLWLWSTGLQHGMAFHETAESKPLLGPSH